MGAAKEKVRFDHLDGIRGSMALWVFLGHLYFACNARIIPFGAPALAVEIFMVLSGFLMAFHWEKRYSEDFTVKALGDFYARRFFRIVPLFFLLVLVAHVTHVAIATERAKIVEILHNSSGSVHSPDVSPLSWGNLLLHLTFLFGLLPGVVSTNNLPDWSISLEIQFYLLVPFLMVGLKRLGLLTISVGVLIIGVMSNQVIGVYAGSSGIVTFPQPSILPLKIHVFMVGILVAMAYNRRDQFRESMPYLLTALMIVALSGWSWRVMIILGFLVVPLFLSAAPEELATRFFRTRIMCWLGDISYSLYLVHNLVMYPVLGFLVGSAWFVGQGAALRFVVAVLLIAPLVVLVSWLLYRFVELPGLRLGRRWMSRPASR